MRRLLWLGLLLGAAVALFGSTAGAYADGAKQSLFKCDDNGSLCTEPNQAYSYEGNYIGHDEPSILFYSDRGGSGNSQTYKLTLPTDPPTQPAQDGSGGTWNFQLHPAFWFGVAMCDDQSAPNPGGSSFGPTVPCTPNSDTNI